MRSNQTREIYPYFDDSTLDSLLTAYFIHRGFGNFKMQKWSTAAQGNDKYKISFVLDGEFYEVNFTSRYTQNPWEQCQKALTELKLLPTGETNG